MEDQPAPFETSPRRDEPNAIAAAHIAAAAMVALAEGRKLQANSPNVRHLPMRPSPRLAITPANRSNTTHGRVEQ